MHVLVGKQMKDKVIKNGRRIREVSHALEDVRPETLVPRGAIQLHEPARILVNDKRLARRGHLA